MPLRTNPTEYAEKWARRTSGATQDYVTGVQRVTEAPGAKAAANVQGYVNGVQASVPKWTRNVSAVTLGEWKDKTANVGAQRIASGVEAARGKVAAKAGPLLQAIEGAVNRVDSMPKATFEQRMARMTAFATEMHKYQGGR